MNFYTMNGSRNLLKKVTTLFLAICMLTTAVLPASAADGVTEVDWTDENIQYIGRWDEEACNHSYWGGAYFKVHFTGDLLRLRFTGPCDILVNVDGQGMVTYWGADGTLDLSHLLDIGKDVHTLQVNSRFDFQEIKFAGLELAEGAETQMPETAEVIEFIGDSITSGYGNTDGAFNSYAWQTASSLGYEHVQTSFSGIALTEGYGFMQDYSGVSMVTQYPYLQPVYYQTDDLRGELVEWEFDNGYKPKAIVINLGTNDYTTGVSAETVQVSYREMLEVVREHNPDAAIVAMTPFSGFFRDEITRAVEAFAAVDHNTYLIDTAGWLEDEDYIDAPIHPTDAGHIKAARQLREELAQIIGEGSLSNVFIGKLVKVSAQFIECKEMGNERGTL